MNPSIKANWVAALRSGKYRRTTDTLREVKPGKHVAYCCLGVLCDVMKEELKGNWHTQNGSFECRLGDTTSWEAGALSNRFEDYIGLLPAQQGDLIRMNDSGSSFNKIADYIEKNL